MEKSTLNVGDVILYVNEYSMSFSNYDDEWFHANAVSKVSSGMTFIIIDVVENKLHRQTELRCIDSCYKKRVFSKIAIERLIDNRDTWKKLT